MIHPLNTFGRESFEIVTSSGSYKVSYRRYRISENITSTWQVAAGKVIRLIGLHPGREPGEYNNDMVCAALESELFSNTPYNTSKMMGIHFKDLYPITTIET